MPRNTRNVWIHARIDGRGSALTGGPAARDGGMSAVVLQRSAGSVGDERVRIATFATGGGTIRTEVSIDTERRYSQPALMLTTHRDNPGATVTLDVPGLDEAVSVCLSGSEHGALLHFRSDAERDAFLSTLPAWRAAQDAKASA